MGCAIPSMAEVGAYTMTNKELWQYFQLFLEVEGVLGSYKYYNRKYDWDVESLLDISVTHSLGLELSRGDTIGVCLI